MRLRIDFGTTGTRRECSWWQPLEDFPTALIFNGERWEWFMFQPDAHKNYEMILTFSHMKIGDSRWNDCVDFERRFGSTSSMTCECGSIHTSAPQFHMFYCPLWRKV